MIYRHRSAMLFGMYSLLCVVFLAWSTDRAVRAIQLTFHYVWTPAEVVVGRLDQTRGAWGRWMDLLRADQRARALEERWLQDRLDAPRLKALEEENHRLTDLLNFPATPGFRSSAARVLGRDAADGFESLLLRTPRGATEGQALAVVDHGRWSVLGQVRDVFPDGTARAMLLTDPFSAMSAQVARTGEQGLIEGRPGGRLMLNYLFADSSVQEGDEVVTAGLGEVFPPNILIGRVVEVYPAAGPVSKRAVVIPAARLGRARELRILQRDPEGP